MLNFCISKTIKWKYYDDIPDFYLEICTVYHAYTKDNNKSQNCNINHTEEITGGHS